MSKFEKILSRVTGFSVALALLCWVVVFPTFLLASPHSYFLLFLLIMTGLFFSIAVVGFLIMFIRFVWNVTR